jgi:hypothetical protein
MLSRRLIAIMCLALVIGITPVIGQDKSIVVASTTSTQVDIERRLVSHCCARERRLEQFSFDAPKSIHLRNEQMALLGTFADQAVIAIENARLLNDLRQRTTDLSEALEQQTATSEVLQVISSSPTNLQSALRAIAETVARLLEVTDADIMRLEGDVLRLMAKHGPSQQWPVGTVRPVNRNLGNGASGRRSSHYPRP